jgi:peptidyl-prolyl cis-trans isomerase SurA
MMIKKIIILYTFILITFSGPVYSSMQNKIIAHVGTEIITSADLENRVRTLLILNNQELNQENINTVKGESLKSIMRSLIKNKEIKKYEVTEYNKNQLNNYIINTISNKNLSNQEELRNLFKQNKIDYDTWVESVKIDILWNTLIFRMYGNQIIINSIEIENDIKEKMKEQKESKEYNLSEILINSSVGNTDNAINDIYKTIQKEGFEKAASLHSSSVTASNKGQLGWINESSLSKIFLKQLNSIDKGQITKPIKVQENYIILKINDIKIISSETVDIEKLKNSIIKNNKEEKLNLFSRSHFSKLENKTLIKLK